MIKWLNRKYIKYNFCFPFNPSEYIRYYSNLIFEKSTRDQRYPIYICHVPTQLDSLNENILNIIFVVVPLNSEKKLLIIPFIVAWVNLNNVYTRLFVSFIYWNWCYISVRARITVVYAVDIPRFIWNNNERTFWVQKDTTLWYLMCVCLLIIEI
jgi:hypothetical protein